MTLRVTSPLVLPQCPHCPKEEVPVGVYPLVRGVNPSAEGVAVWLVIVGTQVGASESYLRYLSEDPTSGVELEMN